MTKILAYTIVTAPDADNLAQAVRRMLPVWQPFGGVGSINGQLCQAMVKYEETASAVAWTSQSPQPPFTTTTVKLPPLEKR